MGVVNLIIASIFGLIGLVVMYFALRQRKIALESESWPYVDGRIVLSKVEEEWSSSTGSTGQQLMYAPKVIYEYSVDGQNYFGERISISGFTSSSSPKMADRTVAEYPMGASVRVYYDPGEPSASTLKVGVKLPLYLAFLFGLVFFAIGSFLVVRLLRV